MRPEQGSGEPELGEAISPEEFFGRVLPSDERFLLAGIWSDHAQASRLHRVARCRVWGPEGVGSVSGGEVEWQRMAEIELAGGGLSLKAVRLDLSPSCSAGDLRIFAAQGTPQMDPEFADDLR